MITTIGVVTICPQGYYDVIDHISYAIYYFSMTYLLYDWRFLPLNSFHLFNPSLNTLPSDTHQLILCIYEFVSVLFFSFHIA